ncbi:MAG: hypothetical protein ABI823_15720, partial [Bryobacteraceae bacterium]
RAAYDAVKTLYESDYAPQTLQEKEVVIRMVETQWQLTRVARLIDLAFTNGGDLMTTSKMMDNYSRHQTRLHRMHLDLVRRMDSLIDKRDPDTQPGFDDMYEDAPEPDASNPETTPEAGPTSPASQNHRNELHEIGFVLHAAIAESSDRRDASETSLTKAA